MPDWIEHDSLRVGLGWLKGQVTELAPSIARQLTGEVQI
jgi:hypothetical protein